MPAMPMSMLERMTSLEEETRGIKQCACVGKHFPMNFKSPEKVCTSCWTGLILGLQLNILLGLVCVRT